MSFPGRRLALGCAAAGLALAATGCSASSPAGSGLAAAPLATTPACTTALGRAPDTVLGKPRVQVAIPGARAWGDPAIVLRCGLPALDPTPAPCLNVSDVDWVIADPAGDPIVFETYGRSPAVEVRVPAAYGRQNATAALVDLAPVAAALPRTARACLG